MDFYLLFWILSVLIIVFSAIYFTNRRNRILSVKRLEELKKKTDPQSKEQLNKLCPVCGFEFFKQFGFEPDDSQEICPGCGIQFGYDDAAGGNPEDRIKRHNAWRKRFVKG